MTVRAAIASPKRGERHVPVARVGDVHPDLVGDHGEVVLERDGGDRLELVEPEDPPGRVVGVAEEQQPGARVGGQCAQTGQVERGDAGHVEQPVVHEPPAELVDAVNPDPKIAGA